ncbi:MAG: hypothetical protein CMJ83_09295 [Planctomycetes bacterium]|nr:hypothetical protein [Planctomycetota bacterium]
MRSLWWGLRIWWLRRRGAKAAARAAFRCHEKLRLRILGAFGARIGEGTRIKDPMIIMGRFHDFSNLTIGIRTYVGPDCLFDLSGPVRIGDRAAVSARCVFVTHLDVGAGSLKHVYPPSTGDVEVGDETWLGVNTTVLAGSRIGSGSMVAAGAVVRGDVPDAVLAAGVPARVIRPIDAGEAQPPFDDEARA